jgi:hypothetical protein
MVLLLVSENERRARINDWIRIAASKGDIRGFLEKNVGAVFSPKTRPTGKTVRHVTCEFIEESDMYANEIKYSKNIIHNKFIYFVWIIDWNHSFNHFDRLFIMQFSL